MTAGRQAGRPDLLGFRFILFFTCSFLFSAAGLGGLVWDWLDPCNVRQPIAAGDGGKTNRGRQARVGKENNRVRRV